MSTPPTRPHCAMQDPLFRSEFARQTFVTTAEAPASHARLFITNGDRTSHLAKVDTITYVAERGPRHVLHITYIGVDDMVTGDPSAHWRGDLARMTDEIEIAAGREVMVTISFDSSALPPRLQSYAFSISLRVDGELRQVTATVSRAERLRRE
jgi:hypothetical protein